MKNKKVLVVVTGGVPTIYADQGVDAVSVDLDDLAEISPEDTLPIHSDYLPHLSLANIAEEVPVASTGRVNDAYHLTDNTWIPLSDLAPPTALLVECVLKPQSEYHLFRRAFLWLHEDQYWKSDSALGGSQTFPFDTVIAWSYVRPFTGDANDF